MIKLEQEGRSWYFNPDSFMYAQIDRDTQGYITELTVKFSYYDDWTSLTFEGKFAEDNYKRIEEFLVSGIA